MCGHCGYMFPIAGRKVTEVDGELQEVVSAARAAHKAARQEQGRAGSIEALTEIGKMRGYRNPRAWAEHVLRGRQQKGRVA